MRDEVDARHVACDHRRCDGSSSRARLLPPRDARNGRASSNCSKGRAWCSISTILRTRSNSSQPARAAAVRRLDHHRMHRSADRDRRELRQFHRSRRARRNKSAVNLEAAEEIGRQLRLRGIGGLIVIDFIHVSDKANVESADGGAGRKPRARPHADADFADVGIRARRNHAQTRPRSAHAHDDGMSAAPAAGAAACARRTAWCWIFCAASSARRSTRREADDGARRARMWFTGICRTSQELREAIGPAQCCPDKFRSAAGFAREGFDVVSH